MRYKTKRRMMPAALAMLFAASMFLMSAVPSFAYINRGNVVIGDPGSTELKVGESTTMSITPFEEQHLPGCGMADCPTVCGEKNCITYINGQMECTCQGTELQTYYATVSPHSSDESVATISYDGKGNCVITAVGAGTCQISVCADFREYNGASKTVNLTVVSSDPVTPTDPDTPSNPDTPVTPTDPDTPVTPAAHKITVEDLSEEGCTLTADKTTASKGDTVALTAETADGYTFEGVTVTASDGSAVDVSGADGSYSFTMPDSDVTVKGTVKKDSSDDGTVLPFKDVAADRWSRSAVEYVYKNNIFAGTAADEFSPEMNMSRAMLVSVLYRMDDSPSVSGAQPFTDVADGAYYADAVRWASANGIVSGTGENQFSPDADVTREQFATILYRYAQYKNYNTDGSADISSFADSADVSAFAQTALKWAVSDGVISGTSDDRLMPLGGTTREQAASMLMRFMTAEK